MPADWLVSKNQQQSGPFTSADLRKMVASGQLHSDDLLWKEGMPKWLPASKIKGLFVTPPPLPKTVVDPACRAPAALNSSGDNTKTPLTVVDPATPASVLLTILERWKNMPNQIFGQTKPIPEQWKALLAGSFFRFNLVNSTKAAIGIVVLLTVIAICVALLPTNGSIVESQKKPFENLSFEEHPTIIVEALRDGKSVWQLRDLRMDDPRPLKTDHKSDLYIIANNGHVESVVEKNNFLGTMESHGLGLSDQVRKRMLQKATASQILAGETRTKSTTTSGEYKITGEQHGDTLELQIGHRFEMVSSDKSELPFETVDTVNYTLTIAPSQQLKQLQTWSWKTDGEKVSSYVRHWRGSVDETERTPLATRGRATLLSEPPKQP